MQHRKYWIVPADRSHSMKDELLWLPAEFALAINPRRDAVLCSRNGFARSINTKSRLSAQGG